MSILIGSQAIKLHFPEFPREPRDVDVWSKVIAEDPLLQGGVDFYWDDRLLQWFKDVPGRFESRGPYVPTPDELFTIKVSHAAWELDNGSWNKHMHDIVWMQDRGCRLVQELYDVLYPIWEDLHGKKPVNLNLESSAVLDMDGSQKQRGFFQDAVVRKYDHDSIHYSVAYTPGVPIYESVLKDGKSVAMDMSKVWALPHDQQIRLFREEVYATALERWVIPTDYEISPGVAHHWALKKTITSLTKGRSALFLILNYRELRDADMDYVAHHLDNRHYLAPLEA